MSAKNGGEDVVIERAVRAISSMIVEVLEHKGLLSLILVGTISSREERTRCSDIDFFAIVESSFDYALEDRVNERLEEERDGVCAGFEARLRCFDLDFLRGGASKTVVQSIISAPRLVQRLAFYDVVWGERFDYTRFAAPMSLAQEARFLISQVRDSIERIRTGTYPTSIHNFYKLIIELVRVEAQMCGFEFHPDRCRLESFFAEEMHIIHHTMRLRRSFADTPPTDEETLSFCDGVEEYVRAFEV